ncbi:hypothetical protein [Nocardia thailandica]
MGDFGAPVGGPVPWAAPGAEAVPEVGWRPAAPGAPVPPRATPFGAPTPPASSAPFGDPTPPPATGTPFGGPTPPAAGSPFGAATPPPADPPAAQAPNTGVTPHGGATPSAPASPFGAATPSAGASPFSSASPNSGGSPFGEATPPAAGSSGGDSTPSAGASPFGDATPSAPASPFGEATPPPVGPPAGQAPSATASPFGGATPPPAGPFGAPTPEPGPFGAPPPISEATTRFGTSPGLPVAGARPGTDPGRPLTGPAAFGAPTPAPTADGAPFGAPTRPRTGEQPFGGPADGADATEVIRRESAGRAVAPDAAKTSGAQRVPSDADDDQPWWSKPDDDGLIPKPPAEPGLSWADDPIARRLAPATPAAPQRPERPDQQRLYWIIGGAAAAVLLVIGLVVTIGFVKRGGEEGPTSPPIAATTSATDCKPVSEQGVTVGNGPGDTTSGARAILGFQYAFYHDRSGPKVREFVAPDAEINGAEVIQQAIDTQVPQGTTHCVRIRQTDNARFDVQLTEFAPGGRKQLYRQEILTTNRDGKWLIVSVTPR